MSKNRRRKRVANSCPRMKSAKYVGRPGPPYPAQQCQGQYKNGNDRKLYRSVRDSRGIYRWQKVVRKSKRRRA